MFWGADISHRSSSNFMPVKVTTELRERIPVLRKREVDPASRNIG